MYILFKLIIYIFLLYFNKILIILLRLLLKYIIFFMKNDFL